jgi:hypothetical protein
MERINRFQCLAELRSLQKLRLIFFKENENEKDERFMEQPYPSSLKHHSVILATSLKVADITLSRYIQ